MALKTSKNTLNPDQFQTTPYDADRLAPPTLEDLSQLGIKAPADEKAIPIQTKVRPAISYAVDRILEKKIYNMKSRQDFFRLALMNLVATLEYEISEESVRLSVRRIEEQRRALAEITQLRHVADMVALTQKVVKYYLSYGERLQAIHALRRAKRFGEDIPLEGLRAKYHAMLYGSLDGQAKPEGWENDEGAMLWDKVLGGELDRDDEAEIRERLKIYG